jgi:pyruvate,orthophosphate dikinase
MGEAMETSLETKFIYTFGPGHAEGSAEMRDLLGGKGSGLAEMCNAGVPVPPGFTITTAVCRHVLAHGALPEGFEEQQDAALGSLEDAMGKKLGDPNDPLLVSVRSGAKFSMPGMMDTVLNLGLNDRSVVGLARRSSNTRFAWDCYRRFLQMFGSVVLDLEKHEFETLIASLKRRRRAQSDTDLTEADLQELVARFKAHVRSRTRRDFPQDPREQLRLARDAVFRSWNNDRAVYYRNQNGIPHDLGTAVTVQVMVFGNLGTTSATGVGFTRDPATGENRFYGEYLVNAQGEDVVAGVRTPQPIEKLQEEMPQAYQELREITGRLERHYRDVQDFEFTIQEGRLFLLQTRTGKRTTRAAVRIAVEMTKEGLIRREEAVLRVVPESLDQLLHPRFDPKATLKPLARGLAASPGAAVGRAVFDADTAAARGDREKVILVRNETVPDDIHGMDAAQGILTATGGRTSHAAVVARGMGKPCVVGVSELRIDLKARRMTVGSTVIQEGDWISIDGASGELHAGQVPTIPAEVAGELAEFMAWADEFRRLKVRANADVPRDAKAARAFGAQGIGLCRTEHMFFAEERLPWVVEMIMSAPETKRWEAEVERLEKAAAGANGPEARKLKGELAAARQKLAGPLRRYRGALAKLLPFQRADFKGLFREMDGLPVTIRTLDPPLHEFLPKREELLVEVALLRAEWERAKAKRKGEPKPRKLAEREKLLQRVEELHEFNPMLGHRGCRLGITYPEVTEMQVRAIFEAACDLAKSGTHVVPEVMIPLVGHVAEFRAQAAIVRRVAGEVMERKGAKVEYLVGTMIEVPRAAVTAGQIASQAEFFSFGTNDLTQMAFGFSRDDAGKFLGHYLSAGMLPADPFEKLDREGVGALMRLATEDGRAARPALKVGICGEHGGEPSSVEFCHELGLDYVSCSPFRVPVARLAAAHAALKGRAQASDQR